MSYRNAAEILIVGGAKVATDMLYGGSAITETDILGVQIESKWVDPSTLPNTEHDIYVEDGAKVTIEETIHLNASGKWIISKAHDSGFTPTSCESEYPPLCEGIMKGIGYPYYIAPGMFGVVSFKLKGVVDLDDMHPEEPLKVGTKVTKHDEPSIQEVMYAYAWLTSQAQEPGDEATHLPIVRK